MAANAGGQETAKEAAATTVKIGLSFFVERYGDVTLIGHSGDQNGFISHLYLHPPSRTAWVVNFNTDVTTKGRGTKQDAGR